MGTAFMLYFAHILIDFSEYRSLGSHGTCLPQQTNPSVMKLSTFVTVWESNRDKPCLDSGISTTTFTVTAT